MSLTQAEEEFSGALARMTGEQYELLTVQDPEGSINSPLFTIRHVYRSSPTKVTALGIYYVLEGVIYKSPSARSLMKASVTRTTQGLIDACDALKKCARYSPTTGYYWDFESSAKRILEEETETDIFDDFQRRTKTARTARRVLDNRPAGERSQDEEEGSKAKEKMNNILLRLKASIATKP